MAKNSSPRIQEWNSRAKTKKREGKKPKMAKTSEAERITGDSQYAKVVPELESMKQELNNLKLDMASVLQEKRLAEQETDSSILNIAFHVSSLETIRREIEETNEENVLVELSKIEAIKEYGEIEAQRKEKNELFLKRREVTRNKMKKMAREIEYAKILENKLAVTLSDINLLVSQELEAVKSSELMALENLSTQIEITRGNKASTTQHSSKVTISKFEYEYLIKHADTAKEIADKKVAAAHAWIEALKACEKENIITAKLSRKETSELKVEEE